MHTVVTCLSPTWPRFRPGAICELLVVALNTVVYYYLLHLYLISSLEVEVDRLYNS